LLGLFYKEKMVFVLENEALMESGRRNFKKYVLNDNNFKKYFNKWNSHLKKYLMFQSIVTKENLKTFNNQQLKKVFEKWSELYLEFWTVGLIPEVSNWGGEDILSKELEKKVSAKDFIKVFERLSAPEKLSFYQTAELDLLELKKYAKNKKIFENKIDQYQKKHFWILNSYHHTRVLSKDYFKKELSSYSSKKASQHIKQLLSFSKNTKIEKQKIFKKHRLGPDIKKIANRLSFCIWWQDYRKYYIFLANHHLDIFLKEFSRRFKIPFKNLPYYNYSELLNLTNRRKIISQQEINKRFNNLVVYYNEPANKLKYISGNEAKKIIVRYMKVKVDKQINEVKGVVVSRGKKINAPVKILESPKEVKKMKDGDILVAAMTSPDYIIAIKKASAIVTDEGGMTCHAAIVSRELGIPCIVNTKIATKVFKDNQIVEVDTTRGVVKK